MRKFSYLALGAAVLLVLGAASEGWAKNLRLGHIRATNHPTHIAALKFKEILEAESNGAFTVKVYPNSQLGNPKEMFVQLQTGDLEMVYGGINTFAWIKGAEAFEITAIPFLFRDYDHMKKSLDSDFFKPIIAAAEKDTGVKIVAISGDTTPRGLSTKGRAIKSAGDFKGLKIRTAASPTVLRAMKTLGAMPQQIPFAELYMALKTGVVDAQENGAMVVWAKSLHEVQDYYVKTDYIRDIETFYMSGDIWAGLPQADQRMITKAAEAAGVFETELLQKQMGEVYDNLRKKMTVIDQPDLASIRDTLKGAFDGFEGEKWPKGLIAKISGVK
ncbi:MAG: TRAP transporter substrate-binding protein [Rhodospirillales bacterium]|nr:TRAP transporter substrate-binding protein [Rhodospirillales bacterium]